MYSFKYHLVTICAVFLALAGGLLLGAAIGGSGLLSTTTSDLVDSLFDKYSDLSSQNDELDLSSKQYEALSGSFVDKWDDGKLANMDVVILTGTSSEDSNASREVAGYVTDAGGRYTIVHVDTESYGTSNSTILAALRTVVPTVEGEEYTSTLAQALAKEWTARTQQDTVFDGGTISSSSNISDGDKSAYPVTTCLIQNGIISIENSSHIPDTISGCINMHVNVSQGQGSQAQAQGQGSQGQSEHTDSSDSSQTEEQSGDNQQSSGDGSSSSQQGESNTTKYVADTVSLQIANQLKNKGAAVVFTQNSAESKDLMDQASRIGIAGVSSCSGYMGRYSIVSLLVSKAAGVYGPDRDSSFWYPSY